MGAAPLSWTRAGAHSFLDGKRWENTRDFSAYVAAEGNPARTDLGAGGDLLEWVMLSLRLERGLDMAETERRYGRPAREELTRQAKRLEAGGFLIRNGERMTLTEKGFDLQNAVIVELIKNL